MFTFHGALHISRSSGSDLTSSPWFIMYRVQLWVIASLCIAEAPLKIEIHLQIGGGMCNPCQDYDA